MKAPAFQFYPGDWRRDTALRACSLEARGLWIELMCVMHDGEPYGHLAIAGVGLSDDQAASIVGLPLPRYRRLLGELERLKVSSRQPDGTLYSRRMVRDDQVRAVRAACGNLGGNPALKDKKKHKAKVKDEVKPKVNQTSSKQEILDKQKPTPAVASALTPPTPSCGAAAAASPDGPPPLAPPAETQASRLAAITAAIGPKPMPPPEALSPEQLAEHEAKKRRLAAEIRGTLARPAPAPEAAHG